MQFNKYIYIYHSLTKAFCNILKTNFYHHIPYILFDVATCLASYVWMVQIVRVMLVAYFPSIDKQFYMYIILTHLPLVPHKCVSELGQHWFRSWLVTFSAPSRYLNQCWVIFNWTLRNKLHWNYNQNTKIFIHENAAENIVCEMVAILSRERWVKNMWYSGIQPWISLSCCWYFKASQQAKSVILDMFSYSWSCNK